MTTTEAGERPGQGRQKPQFIEPVSQTVALLHTETARLYTNLHPVLILGPIYLFFGHLVQDPVTTLSWTVLPLAILQCAYCTVCLPPSSGSSTPSPASKTPKKKRVQFAKQPPTTRSKLTVSTSRENVRGLPRKGLPTMLLTPPLPLDSCNLSLPDLLARNTAASSDINRLWCPVHHSLLT